ncbi:methyltransferase domain-containing protein [Thalassomonas haliotis]|uniref:Methyltransferase domain-containing protein n=1 Tax=Thalassomonas haliotis TaxID=485448 RepID=A0ABY7VDS4_9GAMM|nr:methyltransferase domain-containing protein [Thalassomonas haliotis]WDE11825.1 methyltransferase domain-containing protein [Thalassomonas haliotis]
MANEFELVEALQPIRGMALATSINHFYTKGIYDELVETKEEYNIDNLAAKLNHEAFRLEGLLKFLRNEGFVNLDNNKVKVTDKAVQWSQYRAWYEMMVGGYAQTFMEMGDALEKGSAPASRNASWVGIGSCGISMYDSIPIVKKLLAELPEPPKTVVDLGCGSGVYLTEICKWYEQTTAIGIEPDEGGCIAAKKHVAEQNLTDRIQVAQADAITYIQGMEQAPDMLLLCFVIHEVLGQSGEQAVIDMINAAMTGDKEQRLMIIDIDYLIDDKKVMAHSLSTAYYNSYFLLHPFTSQQLEKQAYWDELFGKCGLEIEHKMYTDPAIDSTDICMGWMLKKK